MKRTVVWRSVVKGIALAACTGLAIGGPAVTDAAASTSPHYSIEYLQGIHRQLDAGPKIPGTAWGVDLSTGTMLVSYDSMVTGAELDRLKSLTQRFGDAIRFRRLPGALTTKIGGGVRIHNAYSTSLNLEYCTLGFNAVKDGVYYFFTAGHCTNDSVWWYTDPNRQGYLGYRVTSIYPGSDIGIVRYTNTSIPKPGVIARYDGTVQDITHARDPGHGEFVCKSGSVSGYTCGHVTNPLRSSVTYRDGSTVYNVIEASVCAAAGDSGAPLHAGRAALGVLSGGSACGGGQSSFYERVTEFQTRGIYVY